MKIFPMIDLNHGQDWHLWNFCFTLWALWKFKDFSATQKFKTRQESIAQNGSDQNPLPKMGRARIHCPKWVWSESTAQNGSGQNPLPKMGRARIHCPNWVLSAIYLFQVLQQSDWRCRVICRTVLFFITTSSFTEKIQTIMKASAWNVLLCR